MPHTSVDLMEEVREHRFTFEALAGLQGRAVSIGFEPRRGGYKRSRYYPAMQDGLGVVLPSSFTGTVQAIEPQRRFAILTTPLGFEITLQGWLPREKGPGIWPASDPPGGTDYLEVRILHEESIAILFRLPLDRIYLGPAH